MSVRLMSAVWDLDLPSGEKLVLLALADQANDEGLQCWPSVATIAKRSGQGERTVRRALADLETKGHLTRDHRDGNSTQYRVHPGQNGSPAKSAPLPNPTGTPAKLADKPSGNTKPSEGKPSSGTPARKPAISKAVAAKAKKTQLPANFIPALSGRSAEIVAEWPPGALGDEIDHWRAYHEREGSLAANWNASFRTWVHNSKRWSGANGQSGPRLLPQASGGRGAPVSTLYQRLAADRAASGSG